MRLPFERGANWLAMITNDTARLLNKRSDIGCIASKLAPTNGLPDGPATNRKLHILQRKTSNPRAHLVQSQPL
ncbi:hypothetical protein [Pseudomonas sp. HY7a-MNA-CIBAN-0227]|uniref:hypothetical protein n=1 Tax=Pseudomonas sp. HY7a-MNA-CIBAN-0227 TaxID=3140474 RepID=UPI003334205B